LYDYAAAVSRVQEGYEELGAVSEETWDILKEGPEKNGKEWSKSMTSMRSTMAKLFNTDMEKISSAFVEKHLDNLEKMVDGTEEEA
jgi:hypothetical protein